MRIAVLIFAVIVGAGLISSARAADLPTPQLTPGVARKVTLHQLCTTSTKTVRAGLKASVKKRVYKSYGLPGGNCTAYCSGSQGCEIDHLISLELGGSNDPKNLWPEPYQGTASNAHVKDRLENYLHDQVCNHGKPLKDAQTEIASNWIAAFKKYLGNDPSIVSPNGKEVCR